MEFVVLRVFLIWMASFTVVFMAAEVPPNAIAFGLAVPELTPPFIMKYPEPMQVPAVPTVRITRSKARYHAAMAAVTVPTVKLAPSAVELVLSCGVMIAVPPVREIVPPARTQ